MGNVQERGPDVGRQGVGNGPLAPHYTALAFIAFKLQITITLFQSWASTLAQLVLFSQRLSLCWSTILTIGVIPHHVVGPHLYKYLWRHRLLRELPEKQFWLLCNMFICLFVCGQITSPQPCGLQSQNFTCVVEILKKFSGEVCAGGVTGATPQQSSISITLFLVYLPTAFPSM